jgi:hypothetical protein
LIHGGLGAELIRPVMLRRSHRTRKEVVSQFGWRQAFIREIRVIRGQRLSAAKTAALFLRCRIATLNIAHLVDPPIGDSARNNRLYKRQAVFSAIR